MNIGHYKSRTVCFPEVVTGITFATKVGFQLTVRAKPFEYHPGAVKELKESLSVASL